MKLTPWTREFGLGSLQDEMNRLFGRFGNEEWNVATWAPAVDVTDTDDTIVARAEVPGLAADDLEISVLNDNLVLKGEKRQEEEKKGQNWSRVERRYGAFSRTIPLPCPVDVERMKAEMDKGVLTVTLAKSEAVKPRRITVKPS